jgi:hypothetical protein
MRALLALFLALAVAACAGSERIRSPGADVWGNMESGVYGEIGEIASLRIAPPEGAEADGEIEAILGRSLALRGYTASAEAPLALRYMMHTTLTDGGDDGLGIAVGGSAGDKSGVDEFGIGFDLPFLSGGDSVRQTAFLFELRLEGADGALLWRGRASGRTHFTGAARIARPVAPLLIERLGRETPPRLFAR